MSFHGGLIGVIVSSYIFCKIKKLNYFKLMDVIACAAPIGIFLGDLLILLIQSYGERQHLCLGEYYFLMVEKFLDTQHKSMRRFLKE